MRLTQRSLVIALVIISLTGAAGVQARAAATDPLPSWNDGPAKRSILAFVDPATKPGGPDYVEPGDRIATFDNDGTLWVEHPLYAQGMFALDRARALAPSHPEWNGSEPFKTVLSVDKEALAKLSEQDWAKLIAVTHSGMSTEAFIAIAKQWLETATQPRFGRRYTELVYQPMIEVMALLRANGFKTYIVTGGGQEFVRAFGEGIYGIPPEQILGSSTATKYVMTNGTPTLMREPKIFFIDDHEGKPIGINLFIGKRPYAAFGNSSGDQEMLEWTGAGKGARLKMLVYHDDATREYAYGPAGGLPDTKVGTFPEALMNEARDRGWTVISMRNDRKTIFPAAAAAP